jgi:hypothetical protein
MAPIVAMAMAPARGKSTTKGEFHGESASPMGWKTTRVVAVTTISGITILSICFLKANLLLGSKPEQATCQYSNGQ